MSDGPFTSVITPVYNGAAFLSDCLESVRAQSHEALEHVILDNASTDGTDAIIARHAETDARVRVHRNPETLPVIDNWNRALELMAPEARYCRVLHADDTMAPDYLARTVALAERHPEVGIVGCLRRRGADIQCRGLPADREVFPGAEIARLFLSEEVFAFAPTSNLLRADLVRARRPFYPPAYLHADLVAYFELLSECAFGFVHDVLADSRVHEGSITATVAERDQTILREWLLMLQRYGPRFFDADELARRERAFLRRYYRVLVRGAVTGRGRDFLRYHLAGLREAGRTPGPLDLLGAVGAEAAAAVTRPGRLVHHLRAARRHGGG